MLYVCVCISCLQSEVQEERVIGLSRGSCPLLPILVQAQRGSSFRVKSSEMTISGAIPRKQYEMLCYNPKIAHVCYRPKRKKKKKVKISLFSKICYHPNSIFSGGKVLDTFPPFSRGVILSNHWCTSFLELP